MGSRQISVRFLIVILTQLSLFTLFADPDLDRMRQFAEKGEAESQFRLGRVYDEGKMVPQNRRQAVKWYRKAAEQGYAPAEAILGACYNDGSGVKRNIEEAVRWTTKSAEHGFAPAQFRLGHRYSEGKGVAKDPKEALKWWRLAAEQGDADAENALGVMYDTGTLVEENKQTAFDWFLKGARHGSTEARFNVALFYQNGTGVKKDAEKAAYWYRQAAEAGSAVAQNNLGVMLRDGLGVRKDPMTAFKWFTIAARQGMKEADDNRKPLFKTMDGKEIAAAIKDADTFVVKTKAVPDGDGVISGKSDAAIERLLHGGHLFRLATHGPSAAREYEFTVTISCAKPDNCSLTPTVYHFIARPGDLAVIAETTNGLPLAFARNGFCVMLDYAQPGQFQICDDSTLKLTLSANKQIDYDLSLAINKEGLVPDVEFDLRRVLEYAFLHGKETHFDEQTQEIDLTLQSGTHIRIQQPSDGHATKLGITSLTLEKEIKTHFTDFVLGNIPRSDLLKLKLKDFAELESDARKVDANVVGTAPLPKDFFKNPAAKKAAERLKAILDRHAPSPSADSTSPELRKYVCTNRFFDMPESFDTDNVKQCRLLVKANPNRFEAHLVLANALGQTGLLEEAVKEFRTVDELASKVKDQKVLAGLPYKDIYALALYVAADKRFMKDASDLEALKMLEQAVGMDLSQLQKKKRLTQCYSMMGMIYLNRGFYDKAIEISNTGIDAAKVEDHADFVPLFEQVITKAKDFKNQKPKG